MAYESNWVQRAISLLVASAVFVVSSKPAIFLIIALFWAWTVPDILSIWSSSDLEELWAFNVRVQATFFFVYCIGRIESVIKTWKNGSVAGLHPDRALSQFMAHYNWFLIAFFVHENVDQILAVTRGCYLLFMSCLLIAHFKTEEWGVRKLIIRLYVASIFIFGTVHVLQQKDWILFGPVDTQLISIVIVYGFTFYTMFRAMRSVFRQIKKSLKEGTYNVHLLDPILNISLGLVAYIQVRYMYLKAIEAKEPTLVAYVLAFYITSVISTIALWQLIILRNWLRRKLQR